VFAHVLTSVRAELFGFTEVPLLARSSAESLVPEFEKGDDD
jgi:hypothetical protein